MQRSMKGLMAVALVLGSFTPALAQDDDTRRWIDRSLDTYTFARLEQAFGTGHDSQVVFPLTELGVWSALYVGTPPGSVTRGEIERAFRFDSNTPRAIAELVAALGRTTQFRFHACFGVFTSDKVLPAYRSKVAPLGIGAVPLDAAGAAAETVNRFFAEQGAESPRMVGPEDFLRGSKISMIVAGYNKQEGQWAKKFPKVEKRRVTRDGLSCEYDQMLRTEARDGFLTTRFHGERECLVLPVGDGAYVWLVPIKDAADSVSVVRILATQGFDRAFSDLSEPQEEFTIGAPQFKFTDRQVLNHLYSEAPFKIASAFGPAARFDLVTGKADKYLSLFRVEGLMQFGPRGFRGEGKAIAVLRPKGLREPAIQKKRELVIGQCVFFVSGPKGSCLSAGRFLAPAAQ